MVTAQTTSEVMTVSVGVAMKETDSTALVMYCINICCTASSNVLFSKRV